ncbi:MAG: phosphopentomutase [Lachnospiraceae bacterium]|nr:phosphopentomutase [Lachnospiraceae bacterium]
MDKRVFLIVLDSFGIGEMPDAADFGDAGSNTLRACVNTGLLRVPFMQTLGLTSIDNTTQFKDELIPVVGCYGRLEEKSKGKDTTTGHWEIAGLISEKAMPTFPNGFPKELLEELEKRTGRGILCNKPYSGTDVIRDYGEEQLKTGKLIVYTSADSVLQIAAHEELIPVEELYKYCEIAREICQGDWGVGRVIARPFIGEPGNFKRTTRRHDFSLVPPKKTMCNKLQDAGIFVQGVGKIYDIFAGSGITETVRTEGNADGIEKTIQLMDTIESGLCFVNLVDFDMLYGHRNDAVGYANALNYFDEKLPDIAEKLRPGDLLMITADHGCDPSTPSTDHSREYVPLMIFGEQTVTDVNLGTIKGFDVIADTILDYFGVEKNPGSVLDKIIEQ